MSTEIEELKKENAILKENLLKFETNRDSKIKKKQRFFIVIGAFFAGKPLKESIYDSLHEFNEVRKISLNTTSNLIASLVKRLTRIGVIALLIALLPTSLMLYQNVLLKKQNKKIQDQTYLSEASRRASQMFIMGDVLSDINTEVETRKGTSKLSGTLTGRVASLSRAMKPYRYLIGDEIIEKPISPERGQLLITLCKSNLNDAFFVDEILQASDFTKSELANASLKSAVLRDIDLYGSDLSAANLVNVDFRRASLINVNLKYADLEDANLSNASLQNSDLTGAFLTHTIMNGTNLTNTILDSAKVHRADWFSYMRKLKVIGVEDLIDNYKIDSVYYSKTSKVKQPMIIRK